MESNHSLIFEKMFGKTVAVKEEVSIETIPNPILLDIYDGFATGKTSDNKDVMLEFPKLAVVKENKELSDAVIEFLESQGKTAIVAADITEVDVMQTFATVYINGKKVEVEEPEVQTVETAQVKQ